MSVGKMRPLIGPEAISPDQRKLVFDACMGGQAEHVENFYFDSSMKQIWNRAEASNLHPEILWLLYWLVAAKIRDWPRADMRTEKEKAEPFLEIEKTAIRLQSLLKTPNLLESLRLFSYETTKNPNLYEKKLKQKQIFDIELQSLIETMPRIIDQIESPYASRKKKTKFSIYLIDEILLSFKDMISSNKRPRPFFGIVSEIVAQVSGDDSVSDTTVRERANNFEWYPKAAQKRRNRK